MKIVAENANPSLAHTGYACTAKFHPYHLNQPVGRGHTQQEAILDLLRTQTHHSFQTLVRGWLMECFSMEVCRDIVERNHRFLEEALELVQSKGCTRSEAHQLVDYVFDRPVGDPFQEAGGVMITFTALCDASDINTADAGNTELARIWTKIDKIRAKQAAKPKHSPLPEHAAAKGSYLVWSNQHRAWWRPNSQGYTADVRAAGKYARAEAIDIAEHARDGFTDPKKVPDEIAIAIDDLPGSMRKHIAEAS